MDYRFEYDSGHRIVLITFLGDFTELSFIAAIEELSAFVQMHTIEGFITDFSFIRNVRISASQLQKVSDSYPPVAPGKLRIIVAPRSAVFGLARMFQVYREPFGVEMKVVRTMDEALKLLELHAPEFRAFTPLQSCSKRP